MGSNRMANSLMFLAYADSTGKNGTQIVPVIVAYSGWKRQPEKQQSKPSESPPQLPSPRKKMPDTDLDFSDIHLRIVLMNYSHH